MMDEPAGSMRPMRDPYERGGDRAVMRETSLDDIIDGLTRTALALSESIDKHAAVLQRHLKPQAPQEVDPGEVMPMTSPTGEALINLTQRLSGMRRYLDDLTGRVV